MTLHEAIIEVLGAHGGGWMDRDEIAAEIARRNLYRRAHGARRPAIRSVCVPASPSISTSLSAVTRRAAGSACARA